MYKVLYVVAKRFCPDPLETYFYKQQPLGAWKDKLPLYDFSYANTFQNQKVFKTKATGKAIKKKSCFRKLAGWKFYYHSPARIVECVAEYTFLISKTNKQTNKKTRIKKAKETKEEKRISPENRLKNKLAVARVKIFLVICISGSKSFFLFFLA